MTVYNFGSINVDYIYTVERLPSAGETLAASDFTSGLGGKGANQSVAIGRAGGDVRHIGAIGGDGEFALSYLRSAGVDVTGVEHIDAPTGHAIINVENSGENQIVIYPGANRALTPDHIERGLANSEPGDWLILQNETSGQVAAAQMASKRGLHVAYSAAPFDAQAVLNVLPYAHLLIMNRVEAKQLSAALKTGIDDVPVPQILITKGAEGADWIDRTRAEAVSIPAFNVTPVDTTGAGDTFTGYMIAGLDGDMPAKSALVRANAAAALQVQTKGTAEAIPLLKDVLKLIG